MPAKDVRAYVKRNKNDAADAEAICEAVRRPTMRFVRIKSAEQQGQLMLHRARDLLMRRRTQLINALRAHLAEFGITAAQGREGIKELLGTIAQDEGSRLPVDAHVSLTVLAAQLRSCSRMVVLPSEPDKAGTYGYDARAVVDHCSIVRPCEQSCPLCETEKPNSNK